jgi:tRNA dimethylallyltransferase
MAGTASNIWVILGATASGKSELAFALARSIGAEILSVDSMQIYRGMDIGTAKPTPQERAEIKHHLIDVADPNEEFTVARFVELADAVLAKGHPIVVTGGTPLYYKALFEGLFEGPPADIDLRNRLRELDGQELHRRLSAIDPAAANRIHSNDTKRLIRALEVFELTGKPITEHQTEWSAGRLRYDAKWIGLRWEKEILNQRINLRVKKMIDAGWLDEVRALLSRYSQLSKTAGEATGYRQLIQHAGGEISLDDAIEEIKIATRQLARRQLKWFRRFPHVRWIDGDQPLESRLRNALENRSDTTPTP